MCLFPSESLLKEVRLHTSPESRCGPGNLYQSSEQQSLKNIKPRTNYLNDNLTNEERKALYSLWIRPDIVIKKADKGSATVIMSREKYVREVRCHVQNQAYYQKVDK